MKRRINGEQQNIQVKTARQIDEQYQPLGRNSALLRVCKSLTKSETTDNTGSGTRSHTKATTLQKIR
jgi:hypothetical protein